MLPLKVKGNLLWSPANTGPLAITNQVVTIHDVSPLDHPEWSSPRFASWYQFLLPKLASRVHRVLTDSEFSKTRIIEKCGINEDKVTVIPIGVDDKFFLNRKLNTEDRHVIDLPSEKYILSLGSLEPRKNLSRLLQAWELVYRKLPDDIWLVIAGAKGKSMIFNDVSFDRLPPRVFLTGFIPDDDLPMLYSRALASVYLSVYEGFGLPPLESMAAGTPVVSSNAASLPEVIGDSGIMVNPYDIESIADGVLRLLSDMTLYNEISAKGIKRAKEFSWDKCAERTMFELNKVML